MLETRITLFADLPPYHHVVEPWYTNEFTLCLLLVFIMAVGKAILKAGD